MTPRIVRIEDAGPGRKARRLVFDDDTPSRITSAAAVKELCLTAEEPVDADALEEALAEVEPGLAKERALRLLGYRERSEAELAAKLVDSGYGDAIVASIVTRFRELGLVDDERFASTLVRSRVAAGFGKRRIQRELADKGVATHIASAALEDDCPGEAQVSRARESLRGRTATDRKTRDRLVKWLVSRGYDLSTAIETVAGTSADDEVPPE